MKVTTQAKNNNHIGPLMWNRKGDLATKIGEKIIKFTDYPEWLNDN